MKWFTSIISLYLLLEKVSSYSTPTCRGGTSAIVHLFNWKWTDVAAECERFLAPKGFCGVQVSPPQEHRIWNNDIGQGRMRPWYERYQPVSYQLESRSGNRAQFIDMVNRCNDVGVGIFVDAVINHMTGTEIGQACGSGGTCYDTSIPQYGELYGPDDFNCCNCGRCGTGNCQISNYNDLNEVRNCRLVGLTDLWLEQDSVRAKVAGFMNDLIDIGVAGFRVDASKHMWPGDCEDIWGRLSNLNTTWWPANTRPFIAQEVIDKGSEAISGTEYTHLGRVTEFRYCDAVGQKFRSGPLRDMKSVYTDWNMLPSDNAFVFVDNHDNQRGHGGGGSIVTFKDPYTYKIAQAYTLAHSYGFVRVMSSYKWEPESADWMGPPHNPDYSIKDVPINPDGTCGDDWVCEHRWRQITNMVQFRNVAGTASVTNWWDNNNNQVAFSRGDRAFIAINKESYALDTTLTTGLAQGSYCDVISGSKENDTCTGSCIEVAVDTSAAIYISNTNSDPVIAIHADSKVTSCPPPPTQGPTQPPSSGVSRTVVFLQAPTQVGQDVFVRGGINHEHRPGCTNDASTSACAIDITHRQLGTSSHYDKYNAWRVGDTKLDWYGAQSGQGSYQGQAAEGTPTVWTSNNPSHVGYQELNKYGDNMWMVEFDMDCGDAEDGWFELKGFATNYAENGGWEYDINQVSSCSGSVGGSRPYSSNNHMGRCGYVNVFYWSDGSCTVDSL